MTETPQVREISSLKRGLMAWAERHNVRPPEFGRRMGYTYGHAYQLLRGGAEVTVEVIGRLALAYGGETADEVARLGQERA
jgi:plasmid maintenance system antidote protein VapI